MKIVSPSFTQIYHLDHVSRSYDKILDIFLKSIQRLKNFLISICYKSTLQPVKIHKAAEPTNFSNAQLKMSQSFVDIRSISPTICMPTGFANPSGSSFFHATLHFLKQHTEIYSSLIDVLKTISKDCKYDINPFYPSEIFSSLPLEKQGEYLDEILKKQKEYSLLIKLDIQNWPSVPKINLQSLYFHLHIQKAAEIALCFLNKWQGNSEDWPQNLSSRESQLLRLSLVKLIYHNQHPAFVDKDLYYDEKILKIPGISYGINPLSKHNVSSQDFLKALLDMLYIFKKDDDSFNSRPFLEKKSHIYAARGQFLGKKLKSCIQKDYVNLFSFPAQNNFDPGTLLGRYISKIDSRGIWHRKKSTFKAHPQEVLDAAGLAPTDSKSQFHELLDTTIHIENHIIIEVSYSSYLKQHIFSFNLNASNNFEFSFCGKSYRLVSFIAEAGSSEDSSKSLTFIQLESANLQKVFFKCDDILITPSSHQTISKIFEGKYNEPYWGQVRPILLLFEKKTIT